MKYKAVSDSRVFNRKSRLSWSSAGWKKNVFFHSGVKRKMSLLREETLLAQLDDFLMTRDCRPPVEVGCLFLWPESKGKDGGVLLGV